MSLTRRAFLGTACSAAASPLATPIVLAETPGENRLVVIVLRGALDGLGMAVPHGDRSLADLRPDLAGGHTDLDGFFGLGKAFAGLRPLWQAGELGFVHAVSTPYRDRRSHFDGQDLLENGGADASGNMTSSRDGWLNRALALIPGARAESAIAVGRGHMLILDGDAPAGSWAPSATMTLGGESGGLLARLYEDDPLFSAALSGAEMLAEGDASRRGETGVALASYAAERLRGPARVAAFSLGGWDTHRNQARAIRRPATQLTDALMTLRSGLGPDWQRTAVLAVTEFGRTARQNGSLGTDHGTGGAMIVAGGAVRGGRVFGRWPGLGEGDLYQDRDLAPTDDLRRWAGWALTGMLGLGASEVERTVFPGLDMGANPGLLA